MDRITSTWCAYTQLYGKRIEIKTLADNSSEFTHIQMDKTPWSNALLRKKFDKPQLDWGWRWYKYSNRIQKCRVAKKLCDLHVSVSTLNRKKKVMDADIQIDQETEFIEEISGSSWKQTNWEGKLIKKHWFHKQAYISRRTNGEKKRFPYTYIPVEKTFRTEILCTRLHPYSRFTLCHVISCLLSALITQYTKQ